MTINQFKKVTET